MVENVRMVGYRLCGIYFKSVWPKMYGEKSNIRFRAIEKCIIACLELFFT
jgi:hypothetical protein